MDINPDKIIGSLTWSNAILWVLALSGFIFVLDSVGLLPERLAKWFARNRLDSTLKALKLLGVRVLWNEEQKTLSLFESALNELNIREPLYKKLLRELLARGTFNGVVHVGQSRQFTSVDFIDVMGASTDSATALQYARLLNTHRSIENITNFDIVATPKSGSPLLGYEFSKLLGKQFVLGCEPKVEDPNKVMGTHLELDYPKALNLSGQRVLLVDDSTTGGSKMRSLIRSLREADAIVEDALILFEPQGKNAREALKADGVRLHSICTGPSGRF
jgi:orotate phosphoribosyltransferase